MFRNEQEKGKVVSAKGEEMARIVLKLKSNL